MELELEQSQQGSSHEVSVSTEGVEELKRIVRRKDVKKEALHTTLGRNQGIVQIEMELELEQTQQGSSHEVLVSTEGFEELKRIKLENGNVELEFQVFNYARENAHLKTTYKNLFDSIYVSRVQTETKIASLQNELQSNIYKNTKLRTQLFKKVSDQKANTQDTSKNTKFAKQPIAEILPKIGETNALLKQVTSNSVSTPQVSKGMNNAKVISPGMFRISPDKVSKEAKKVPNIVSASSRTKPITVSQPNVITKKDMNSNLNGLSSTGQDKTKTRRPQPRSNTKNDRVPSVSKSSRSKNKEVKVEEHHRNLLLSKKKKHISSSCNNSRLILRMLYLKKHKANVSKNETQQKNQPEIKKLEKEGFIKRLATPKPRKPIFLLRWLPTGKMFDQDGKLVAPSNSESHVDCSNGCSKHMTGNLKLLINFVWKFMGIVCFGNDHVAATLGFGDLQWGNILITRLEWSRHVTIIHQTKDMHTADYTQLYDFLKYNQKEVDELKAERLAKIQDPLALMANSNNPYASQIAQRGMNMGQDRQMQMIGGNGGNQFRQYAGYLNGYNAVQNVRNQVAQNPRVQNDGIQNQIGNGNLVAVRAEGNAAGHNENQIRCYNCRGVGHFARDCTVRLRRRDTAYLQTQLLIAQMEEAGIQLQAEEYD
nr:integrase, catalytic region, zinc finger, CCHC-type, peptidase aspartic, catalytic [Tanacetum cinerariifolium]